MVSKGLFLLSAIGLCIAAGGSVQAQGETNAAPERMIVKAKGHPLLHGFDVMSNKRADWRLARATKPLDVAFTEWLRSERPQVYRQYEMEFFAKRGIKPPEKRVAKKAQKPQKRSDVAQK